MVEFAIVVLLLITLLIGTIEFGYAFFVKGTLAGAAREAARDFAINSDQTHASGVAVGMAPGTNLVAGEITYNLGTCPIGQNVTVSIDHTHQMLTGFFGTQIQLEATGSMRCKG